MQFINDYLEKRKRKKIQNQIADLLEKAYQFQRNGKLREYAELIKQVEELELYFDSVNQSATDIKPATDDGDDSSIVDYDGMGNQGRFPSGEKK